MKRFTFQLQPLLDQRQREQDEVQRKLAAKNAQILQMRQTMASIHDSLKTMQAEVKQKRNCNETVMEMRLSVSYRNQLKLDLLKKGQALEKLFSEAQQIQTELARSTQKKKTLELLKEKRFLEWKKERLRKEQIFIDDISQQSYIRNRSDYSQFSSD